MDLPIVNTNRSCGSCDLCCRLIGVDFEDGSEPKPPGVPCDHLVTGDCGHCGIYAGRPSGCRHYHCMWLDGALPVERKPEHCGIVGELCEIFPGSECANQRRFRLIVISARSDGELWKAKDWLEDMTDDDTIVVCFVPKNNVDTPALMLATRAGFEAYELFCADIRKNGLGIQSADGLQVLEPDDCEGGLFNAERQSDAVASAGG